MENNNNNHGCVYLVGAGPGDKGLITVKGLNILKSADIIIYDYLANIDLLKEARDDAEKIYVGKKAGTHTLGQEQINDLLIKKAGDKKIVVRLKGGTLLFLAVEEKRRLPYLKIIFRLKSFPGSHPALLHWHMQVFRLLTVAWQHQYHL